MPPPGLISGSDRFDGEFDDIFDLQDQVTSRVVGAIAPTLEKAEIERVKYKPTERLDAYDQALRGKATLLSEPSTPESVGEALRLFIRATELDPDFAAAYSYTAFCYEVRKTNGWMTEPAREIAEAEKWAWQTSVLGKSDGSR